MSSVRRACSLESVTIVLQYSLCSTLLLIANKTVVDEFSPAALLLLQLMFCVMVVFFLHFSHLVRVEFSSLLNPLIFFPFFIFSCAFGFGIFANMKVLQHTSAATVLAVRGFVPVAVFGVEQCCMHPTANDTRSYRRARQKRMS